MEGSTFTVSNLGMFGIVEFTINQPKLCNPISRSNCRENQLLKRSNRCRKYNDVIVSQTIELLMLHEQSSYKH
jgi:hypothetical protein